jgi:branched-subunit amino acid ABC-type transport system permease component
MDKFFQTLLDALAVGSLYALIALGYTMVYGILKFINFAHSDVFVLGAWTSYAVAAAAGYTSEPAPIAPWVLVTAGVLAVAAAIAQGLARGGVLKRGLAGPLTIAAIWALGLIAMVHMVRWIRGDLGLPTLAGGLVLLIAMGTCGLVGFSLERLAYKPLRKAPRLNVLITAIGVSLLLQNVGQLDWMFGTRPQGMPTLLQDRVLNRTILVGDGAKLSADGSTVTLPTPLTLEPGRGYSLEYVRGKSAGDQAGTPASVPIAAPPTGGDPVYFAPGEPVMLLLAASDAAEGPAALPSLVRALRVPIRLIDAVGAATAIVLMLILDWLVFRTRTGRAMRAVSHNPGNAALMGINVDNIISFTFVLGAALAAAAGFLYSQKYSGLNQPAAAIWVLLGLKAFVAAVVGGIGNIRGAMLGGLLIGLLEFFVSAYVPDGTQLRDIFVFGLLIAVLLFKPSGILGKSAIEKV